MLGKSSISVVAVLAICTGALLAGCGSSDSSSADKTIGVNLSSAQDPFFVAMGQGITAEAKALGVKTKTTYSEYDPGAELDNVQNLISQQVDGLLISPADVVASSASIKLATNSDLPTIELADHTTPPLGESFIGSPWGPFGAQIAEWICDHAGGNGEIAMIQGPAGASFVKEMHAGFTDYIKTKCPGMSVVFESNANVPTRADALDSAQDALTAHPDLRAIFTSVDEQGAGAVQALKENNQLGKTLVTGFNGDAVGFSLVKNGSLGMTIALRPYHWGQLAVRTMVDLLDDEDVPKQVPIKGVILDQSNIDDVTYQEVR